jgi:hypothetical protein
MPQEFITTLSDDDVIVWTAYCTWTQAQAQIPTFPPVVAVENPQAIIDGLVNVMRLSMTGWAAQHPEAL